MDVDKNDLEEVETAIAFVEKEGVFDKAPLQMRLQRWLSHTANVAAVNANQVEINKKNFDLVLKLNKTVKIILDILSKKETDKHDIDFDVTFVEDFYTLLDINPARGNEPLPLEIELTTGVHEVQPSDIEHVQFKRRKIVNVRYREYTNPLGKQFKINDPCDVNLLHPYDKA